MIQKIRDPKVAEPPRSDELKELLKRIEGKIDVLMGVKKRSQPPKGAIGTSGVGETRLGEALDIMTLLSLPDHLRKSALAIIKLGKATAEVVAKETSRVRAIESSYLNQLARMGYLKRKREGRRVYFSAGGNPLEGQLAALGEGEP